MITVDDARQILGTVAVNFDNQQVGSVLQNLRHLCNNTIDYVVTQTSGTCGTVSL